MITNNHSNNNGHSAALAAALPIPELGRIGRETPDLTTVQEAARALARTIKNEPYDPAKNPDDKLEEEKFQKDGEDLKDYEIAHAHAVTNLKDGERNAAEVQRDITEAPKLPLKIAITAIVAIAISFGTTLHDIFFSHMSDELFAWILSMAAGGFVGALVTWAVGGIYNPSGQRNAVNFAGLLGGLGVGIAGFLLRLAAGDPIIGLALTILEFAAVALVELFSAPLRERYRVYVTARDNHAKQSKVVESLREEVERRKQPMDKARERLEQHKAYVAFRTFCHQKFPEIEAAAVQIATQAFLEKQEEDRREERRLQKIEKDRRLGIA
jgi:hypothetical protein